MRLQIVVSEDPFFYFHIPEAGPLQVFPGEVRDSDPVFVLGEAPKSDHVLVGRIQNLEPTIDEAVFVVPSKLQATFPVTHYRLGVVQLCRSIDARIVVIDPHPRFDAFGTKTCIGRSIPLHWRSGMIASLELYQLSRILQLPAIVRVLFLSTK